MCVCFPPLDFTPGGRPRVGGPRVGGCPRGPSGEVTWSLEVKGYIGLLMFNDGL